MQTNPNRLSAIGRTSPFKRQTSSASPAASPTKQSSNNLHSLSPEKTSPFVRRPSQISISSERPSSPFGRPLSSLSIPPSPSRRDSPSEDDSFISRRPSSVTPAPDEPGTPIIQLDKSTHSYDGARPSSEEPLHDSPGFIPPSPANLRPVPQRTTIASTAGVHQPQPRTPTSPNKFTQPTLNIMGGSGGAYNHIPQSLLHSMRESFEVLDSSNSGAVTSASVSDMLSQLGLDNNPGALRAFFPPNGPGQLNLARYLDVLSGPLMDLSQPEELRAAFEAFDVDDSGQIDVSVLRDALLHTAPNPGEDMIKLSEKEVDGILGEFAGRRAFGSKGVNASKGKGEVFKYRDFMANVGPTATGEDRVAA